MANDWPKIEFYISQKSLLYELLPGWTAHRCPWCLENNGCPRPDKTLRGRCGRLSLPVHCSITGPQPLKLRYYIVELCLSTHNVMSSRESWAGSRNAIQNCVPKLARTKYVNANGMFSVDLKLSHCLVTCCSSSLYFQKFSNYCRLSCMYNFSKYFLSCYACVEICYSLSFILRHKSSNL